MFKYFLLLAALVAISIASETIPECDNYDCPVYTLLSSNSSYEVREYDSALWARTKVQAFYFEEAVNIGFNRLFDYITGENADNIDIDMTAPVAVQIFPGEGPFCKSTFIVSFYVPSVYQQQSNPPPAPTNPEVFIEMLPETVKAVYMFPGYITSWSQLIDPINDLSAYVESEGFATLPNIETYAGYDSPFVLSNRHNEIWMDVLKY